MNPETISIPDCTLDDPVKKSSGQISFCLIPCLHNGERLQVKLPTRFKIYSHSDSFSLGISIPENSLEFFRDLEKHLNALAKEKKKEVAKIGQVFGHPTKLINMPLRGQVVFSVKHLFCGNVKTITCIVDEVLVEEVVQSVSAFDDFEDRDESDLESDEDF